MKFKKVEKRFLDMNNSLEILDEIVDDCKKKNQGKEALEVIRYFLKSFQSPETRDYTKG